MTLYLASGSGPYLLGPLAAIFSVATLICVAVSLFGRPLMTALRSALRLPTSKIEWQDLRSGLKNAHSAEWFEKWTNKWRGMAANAVMFGIVIFAVVMIAAEMLPPQFLPAQEHTEFNVYFPHTDEVLSDTRYMVMILDAKDPRYGTRPYYDFCKEKTPIPFDEGELAEYIIYKEHGTCKEIVHYKLLRDHGHVVKEAINGSGR
jgi:hypothetical protein